MRTIGIPYYDSAFAFHNVTTWNEGSTDNSVGSNGFAGGGTFGTTSGSSDTGGGTAFYTSVTWTGYTSAIVASGSTGALTGFVQTYMTSISSVDSKGSSSYLSAGVTTKNQIPSTFTGDPSIFSFSHSGSFSSSTSVSTFVGVQFTTATSTDAGASSATYIDSSYTFALTTNYDSDDGSFLDQVDSSTTVVRVSFGATSAITVNSVSSYSTTYANLPSYVDTAFFNQQASYSGGEVVWVATISDILGSDTSASGRISDIASSVTDNFTVSASDFITFSTDSYKVSSSSFSASSTSTSWDSGSFSYLVTLSAKTVSVTVPSIHQFYAGNFTLPSTTVARITGYGTDSVSNNSFSSYETGYSFVPTTSTIDRFTTKTTTAFTSFNSDVVDADGFGTIFASQIFERSITTTVVTSAFTTQSINTWFRHEDNMTVVSWPDLASLSRTISRSASGGWTRFFTVLQHFGSLGGNVNTYISPQPPNGYFLGFDTAGEQSPVARALVATVDDALARFYYNIPGIFRAIGAGDNNAVSMIFRDPHLSAIGYASSGFASTCEASFLSDSATTQGTGVGTLATLHVQLPSTSGYIVFGFGAAAASGPLDGHTMAFQLRAYGGTQSVSELPMTVWVGAGARSVTENSAAGSATFTMYSSGVSSRVANSNAVRFESIFPLFSAMGKSALLISQLFTVAPGSTNAKPFPADF